MGLSSVYGAVVQNEGAIFVAKSDFGRVRFDVYLRRGQTDAEAEGSGSGQRDLGVKLID